MTDYVELHDLTLQTSQAYNVSVRAVNSGGLASSPAAAMVRITNDMPRLSGALFSYIFYKVFWMMKHEAISVSTVA